MTGFFLSVCTFCMLSISLLSFFVLLFFSFLNQFVRLNNSSDLLFCNTLSSHPRLSLSHSARNTFSLLSTPFYLEKTLTFTFYSARLKSVITFCSYPKVAISKHFTINQTETFIEARSLICPLNRHFWVGAVMCRLSSHLSVSRLNILVKILSFSLTSFSVTVTNSKGPSCLIFTFLSIVNSFVTRSNEKPTFKSC